MTILNKDNALLIIVDIQEKLITATNRPAVVKTAKKLAKTASILGIPTIITEQYPQGLGETAEGIKNSAHDAQYFEKTSFSIMQEPQIKEAVEKTGKKQIILCGIEAHICVHQTANDLIEAGYEVHVVKDGIASREKFEFKQGIARMQSNGAEITCCEIVLFELLKTAKHPNFKEVQALIK